jgi:nucleotide-binding universal stress UspA family protein
MYQEILIATDGSELASVAAEQGLAVAEQLGANVHVLSIIDD